MRPFDERANLRRNGDADRVGKDDFRAVCEPRCDPRDDLGIDAALERTTERAADRHRYGQLGAFEDAFTADLRLGERLVAVAPVERLGRGEREVDPVESRTDQALIALLVQRESRVLDTVDALDLRDDLFRAGHLRNRIGAHERRGLDARQARVCKPVDELGTRLRFERLRLVLQPVTRSDVADRH